MTQEDFDRLATAIGDSVAICQKEVLTADEAARYMGVSKSYLYKLTMRRSIPHSKPMGKMCYFRREDLERWLMDKPVATSQEIDDEVTRYCLNNKLTVTPKKRK